MDIWVYTEKSNNNQLTKESLKLIMLAKELGIESGGSVTAVSDMSDEALYQAARREQPDVILFASGEKTKSLAARLAVRLDTGISADCLGVKYIKEKDVVHWIRPVYDNSLLAETVCLLKKPQIGVIRIAMQDPSLSWHEDLPVESAEIVVCIGRGCGNGKGMELAKELAKTIGAAIGATRAVTDAGWLPISKQIGQTGKYIRPRIYIGIGVGGAIQHLAGMRNSDIIIAINKDARAPIFEYADYGIVGDLYTVLPIMIQHFEDKKQRTEAL